MKKTATATATSQPKSVEHEPSPRQNEAGFRRVIQSFPPAIQELAIGTRALLFSVLPRAYEVVWEQQKTVGYGTGPKKMTEHFCCLLFAEKHVSLGFFYGTELPDPAGLLEGSGKLMRHVKIKSAADLAAPALKELVRAATTHRVPPLRD